MENPIFVLIFAITVIWWMITTGVPMTPTARLIASLVAVLLVLLALAKGFHLI